MQDITGMIQDWWSQEGQQAAQGRPLQGGGMQEQSPMMEDLLMKLAPGAAGLRQNLMQKRQGLMEKLQQMLKGGS